MIHSISRDNRNLELNVRYSVERFFCQKWIFIIKLWTIFRINRITLNILTTPNRKRSKQKLERAHTYKHIYIIHTNTLPHIQFNNTEEKIVFGSGNLSNGNQIKIFHLGIIFIFIFILFLLFNIKGFGLI